MKTDYLNRCDGDVRALLQNVEQKLNVLIEFVGDDRLNTCGPTGHGMLKTRVEPLPPRIYFPTNGYFSNGAIWHELSHIRRALVDSVPFITCAARGAEELDNAVEHLFIVPGEILKYPERVLHWDLTVQKLWTEMIPFVSVNELPAMDLCINWAFLNNVLPGSSMIPVARKFLERHEGLMFKVECFSKVTPYFLRNGNKGELVEKLFYYFDDVVAVNGLELVYKT